MRVFYTFLFALILPLVLLRLYWRGFKAPPYRKRWLERLAVYLEDYPEDVIWFHAVSVGEAEAVFPLVKLLQSQQPGWSILITTTTPTGSARVKAVLGDSVSHVYLPYDLPIIVRRFLNRFKPRMAVIMEKEIWPNLFHQCGQRNLPLFIINARLSANSASSYQKIAPLVKPALAQVTEIMTQTREDYQRFIEIGATPEQTTVAGNIKFDVSVEQALIDQGLLLKRKLFPGRFVWIIASTHKGEEEIFFRLYPQLKKNIPELLLLVVPRHPERFTEVKNLAETVDLKVVMRSSDELCNNQTDVYLADTMGELKMLYAAADIAFVGGSMTPIGGHNILEPLLMNVPVMFGPHMVNFKEIAENVLADQASVQCRDEAELFNTVHHLYQDALYRKQLKANGGEFLKRNQGATQHVLEKLLSSTLGSS